VKIRLADIDAPETRDYKCASEAALGKRATQRLLDQMNAGPFTVVNADGPDEDVYGRKLRIIERGGRSVADALVAEGVARRWDGARRSWCG
jgi:micrococcal nuclease